MFKSDTDTDEEETDEYRDELIPVKDDYDIDVDKIEFKRKKIKGEGKCGVTKVNTHHNLLRIIGGVESPRGAWPWQVAVMNKFKVIYYFICFNHKVN